MMVIFPDETRQALIDLMVSDSAISPSEQFRSLNVTLRQTTDLYACAPGVLLSGVPSPVLRMVIDDFSVKMLKMFTPELSIVWVAGNAESREVEGRMGATFLSWRDWCPNRSVRLVVSVWYAGDSVCDLSSTKKCDWCMSNISDAPKGLFRNWGYELAREEFGDFTISEEGVH